MKTPREKYMNDPQYRALVDVLHGYIAQAQFTPSEVREAAMMACIKYEMGQLRPSKIKVDPEAARAIDSLNEFVNRTGGKEGEG